MTKDDIIKAARDRLSKAATADQKNRERAADDLKAIIGDQWPEEVRAEREADGRPCLTVNRLPQFVRQVTGDIRRTNPSIDIRPGDGEASQEIAEVLEGLIRDIQDGSDASSVYEAAAESAAACGMGYFRVLTEYEDERSFNQVIRISRIGNPFSVYFDPNAVAPTREDAEWVFITEHLDGEAFKAQYPDAAAVDVEADNFDGVQYWRDGESVVVAEYFWIERKDARLVMLADGRVMVDPTGPVADVVQERETQIPVVKWAKITGKEVLEGPKEFPARHVPVIAVMGEEINLGTEIYRSSVIRHAVDPQRMYNYWVSADTELVALQPKAPWVVTPKQVSGLEDIWAEANDKNRPYLPYNPDSAAPPPQRQSPPVASPAMSQKIAMAAEDMKATTGIYDASLGQRSNEQSGVAIRQRQMESDTATSIYSDNMGKAIAHCGRVILEMIPRVYDSARLVRTIGKDGAQAMTRINQAMFGPDGPMVMNDLSVGRYDVKVSVGPNYSTRRQEAAESMMDFIKAFPAAAPVVGDLVASNMDWPGADQFSDRLKKILPPGLAPQDDQDPQAMQAMQQQMAQQQEAAQMQRAAAQLDLKKQEAEAMEAQAQAAKASADAEKAKLELIEKRMAVTSAIAMQNAAAGAALAPMGANPGAMPL